VSVSILHLYTIPFSGIALFGSFAMTSVILEQSYPYFSNLPNNSEISSPINASEKIFFILTLGIIVVEQAEIDSKRKKLTIYLKYM